MAASHAPIRVDIGRGGWAESRHEVHAVLCSPDGSIITSWGDPDFSTIPRSAIKPFQSVPLIETGTADAGFFAPELIALSSASHGASERHLAWLDGLMHQLKVTDDALECGAHAPYDQAAADALIKAGREPCRIHNNCSGQHLGFIATALHQREDYHGYTSPDHPVQRRAIAVIEEMSGCAIDPSTHAIDGCNAPTFPMPLHGLATAAARLARPDALPADRRETLDRIFAACVAFPELVAGEGRLDTLMMRAMSGAGLTKIGAEGVVIGALRGLGIGFALKVADGAKRAGDAAAARLLLELGAIPASNSALVQSWAAPIIHSAAGTEVGQITVDLPR
jgi:L-asparaginase II